MKSNIKQNKKKLLQCLERSLGIVSSACKEAKLSRNVFYVYYREDEEFKAAVDDINDITLDFTENELLKLIRDGNVQAIMFYMKYKAKKRGYSDSIDVTSGGDKIQTVINIIKPDDKLLS